MPVQCQWRHLGAFKVNFQQISRSMQFFTPALKMCLYSGKKLEKIFNLFDTYSKTELFIALPCSFQRLHQNLYPNEKRPSICQARTYLRHTTSIFISKSLVLSFTFSHQMQPFADVLQNRRYFFKFRNIHRKLCWRPKNLQLY